MYDCSSSVFKVGCIAKIGATASAQTFCGSLQIVVKQNSVLMENIHW
jgi:hypothetical protein